MCQGLSWHLLTVSTCFHLLVQGFTLEQQLSNAFSSFYWLLLNIAYTQKTFGKQWQVRWLARRTCQNLLGLCGHAVHSLLFWQQGRLHDTPYYPRAREERICEHHFSRIKDRFRGTPSLKQGLLGTFRTHLTQMKAGIPSPERSAS